MRISILSAAAIVALAFFTSCNKDNLPQGDILNENGPFEVTIKGEMGEFSPSTKSTAESCIRMKWTAGDKVWAYDKDGAYLGCLTVALDDNDYVAVMSGELSSAPTGGILCLVHSPLATSQPAYDNGLSIDMSTQAADVTPFVAYATVTGVSANVSGLKANFNFATSILKVNATGITKDAALKSASVSGIETVCKLTISDGAFTVTGETSGTITKTLSGTASLSRASFLLGAPAFSAAATGRELTVVAGELNYYSFNVMQAAYASNNYVNYVYDVETWAYIDGSGVNRGEGIYIKSTGAIWAPVNCGYDPTSAPTGLFYQWGRKYGQSNTKVMTADDFITTQATSMANGHNTTGSSSKFYTGNKCWYAGSIGKDYWYAEFNPCPTGWRVPTYNELKALDNLEGVCEDNGRYFPSKSSTPHLFLPFAGYRNIYGTLSDDTTTAGHYWSSSSDETYTDVSSGLSFTSSNIYMGGDYRAEGYSVRCVKE